MELLSTNVRSRKLRGASLLLYGSCLPEEAPRTLARFAENRVGLHICLEKEHMDVAGFKLSTILATAKPRDVTVLTMEGSPHCAQLHFVAEQVKHLTKSKAEVKHYVVLDENRVEEISAEAVRCARHLSEVQKLLREKCARSLAR